MATEYGHYDARPRRSRSLPGALRAPLEGRTWREFGYLLLSLPISIVLFTYAVTMVTVGAGLLITFLGIPVLAAGWPAAAPSAPWNGPGPAACWGCGWRIRCRCAAGTAQTGRSADSG